MASNGGHLHSSSRSSASSDGSRSSKHSSRKCGLTVTSINQSHGLLRLLQQLPQPDPRRDESVSSWCDLFSLESLRLTIPQIIEDCRLKDKSVFEEFPFSRHFSVLGTFVKHPTSSPSRPKAHINLDTLSLKKRYLKLLIKFYENRVHWLSVDSRRSFGLVRGSKVVILAEDSGELGDINEGKGLKRYRECLETLVEEQLQEKETVYLVKFGSRASPSRPEPLHFNSNRTQCKAVTHQWISLLKGEGSCNLLDALRTALKLQCSVDTICVILQTQPDQDLCLIRDYLVDSLSGEDSPQLHFVCLNCPSDSLRTSLADMASKTRAHFHSVVEYERESASGESEMSYVVEDSDITRIREEINKAKRTLCDVEHLKHGVLEDPIVEILRELSLTTDWAEDDDFPSQPRPSGTHCLSCDSTKWLNMHGLENKGLDIYKFLAPNAFPQLSGHVEIVDRMAVSHVYDVMPIFTWHDGTIKYLHIDVEAYNQYIHYLTAYITDTLQPRLQWLLSGSNVPFGTLTESRVVVVLDNSYPVLSQILTLQQHLKLLLEEQLAHVTGFNLVRFGKECSSLTVDFCEPTRQTLLQAWEWILGMSTSGTCDLLSALRLIFESETILKHNHQEEPVGIYLVVTSPPDQCLETLCSYIEQLVTGLSLRIHVIYYNMEYQSHGMVVPGREGGRYGSEEEVEECLRAIARAGRGRFHHFRVSGNSESDDTALQIDEICQAHSYLNTAEKILSDYREFCKRNVPPPPPLVSSDKSPEHRHPPPPTHPRQTAASLARLNVSLKKAASFHSPSLLKTRSRRVGQKQTIKTQSLYTGRGNEKAVSWDFKQDQSLSSKEKAKPLIPHKEFYVSSEEWLSKYSVQRLNLTFSKLLPQSKSFKLLRPGTPASNRTIHKHINDKGDVVDLLVDQTGLKAYVSQLQTVLNRYHSRLEWLHRDCHRYFGAVVESEVVFLLDVSSSMRTHLDDLKNGLSSMLRECPSKLKRFNILTFSSQVDQWQKTMVPTTHQHITEAQHWIEDLKADGGSCLLEAVKVSLQSGAEGIYLVTDGMANHTQDFLLSQLPVLRRMYGEKWRLNTITFDSTSVERDAHTFLKQLAHTTNGRYHTAMTSEDHSNSSQCGDDIALLQKEIKKAENNIKQAKTIL